MPNQIKLPGKNDRIVMIGRTGTGKTVAGLWHLSNQDLNRPWVILNFKNDEHIDSIPNTTDIDYDFIPGKNDRGLFILRPLPSHMKRPRPGVLSPLESYFEKIWSREEIGVFVDESFMLGDNDMVDACLTQGRSKEIPMILCTQRPAWVTRFAFTEASFIQCFDLTDSDDIRRVESFVPLDWDDEPALKKHQSYYYHVDTKYLVRLNPVPPMKDTLKVFDEKLFKKWPRI
jgi:hypothetical protein